MKKPFKAIHFEEGKSYEIVDKAINLYLKNSGFFLDTLRTYSSRAGTLVTIFIIQHRFIFIFIKSSEYSWVLSLAIPL